MTYLRLFWIYLVSINFATGNVNDHAFAAVVDSESELSVWHIGYRDKFGNFIPFILDGGAVIFGIIGARGNASLWDDEKELDSKKVPSTSPNPFVQFNITQKSKFSNYRVMQNSKEIYNGFMLKYKLCLPDAQKCLEKCDSQQNRFCVETSDNPLGVSCSLPPKDSCQSVIPEESFCPGNYSNFCSATHAGIDKILVEYVGRECVAEDKLVHFAVNGRKLHLLEVFAFNKSVTKIDLVSADKNFEGIAAHFVLQNLNTKVLQDKGLCPTHYALDYEKLVQLGPTALTMTGFVSWDAAWLTDFGLAPRAAHLKNTMVVFKTTLKLDKLNDTTVRVDMPLNPEAGFAFVLTATVDGDKIETKFGFITISKLGKLKVVLEQTYTSCVPHVVLKGPALEETLDFSITASPSPSPSPSPISEYFTRDNMVEIVLPTVITIVLLIMIVITLCCFRMEKQNRTMWLQHPVRCIHQFLGAKKKHPSAIGNAKFAGKSVRVKSGKRAKVKSSSQMVSGSQVAPSARQSTSRVTPSQRRPSGSVKNVSSRR